MAEYSFSGNNYKISFHINHGVRLTVELSKDLVQGKTWEEIERFARDQIIYAGNKLQD